MNLKSKFTLINFLNLYNHKEISEESSWELESGVKGKLFKIKINKKNDIDYLMLHTNPAH